VLGSLDPVVRHLALDNPRVVAVTAFGQELEEKFRTRLSLGGVKDLRGKNPGATPWFGAPPGGPA
jgi:hypothetical protein